MPALGRIRHRHHDGQARQTRVGRERLRAVQQPVLAVAPGAGAKVAGVASRIGLGERPGPQELPPCQRSQPALLLRVGSEHRDVRGGQSVVSGDGKGYRRIHTRELLDADGVLHRGHPGATVTRRELDAEQPQLPKLRQQVGGERLRLVPPP